MFKTNLKIAWRNIRKSKLYSGINIFGLSIGLAACLLIGLYISNEMEYDNFHENADNIVRVTMEYSSAGTINAAAVTGTQVGPDLKTLVPRPTVRSEGCRLSDYTSREACGFFAFGESAP